MSEQSAERAPAAAVAAQRTPVKRATESNRTDVGKPVSTGRAAATFEPVGRSVASARGFVRDTLQGWALGEVVDDAVVLTSELVTNAVVHAGGPAVLRLLLPGPSPSGPGALRVEVADVSTHAPRPRRADDEDTHGRGLELISGLADRWGWHREGPGKRIWCELDCP